MAAAVSHAAEATGERDAAVARATELAKERDAALARIAELEARPPQAQPTATADASACAGAQTPPEIESCRNTIQVLYAERDALRQEQQRLTARLVVAGGNVDKADVDAASSNQPIADAYGGLFPNRTATSPLVIVLLMVLLAYGVFSVSKTDLSRTAGIIAPTATSEPTDTPIRAVQEASPTPLAAPNPTPATPLEEVTVIEPEAAADATAAAASSNTAQTENRPLD